MQGHLPWLAAQGHVQMAFEYLHSWRLHSLSGQPVPMPSHPYSQKVLPDVLTEPPVFHFMPFLLSLGTNENSPPLASLHLSSGIYIHWWDPTQPSFLQTKQSQVSQPFCVGEMLHHLSIPLTLEQMHASLGEPRAGHSTAGVASAAMNRGARITSFKHNLWYNQVLCFSLDFEPLSSSKKI